MTITQFIEKAIEGGWTCCSNSKDIQAEHAWNSFPKILLDPLAWQAVGKASDWREQKTAPNGELYQLDEWKSRMHKMIDALILGKTIEQFLETL